EANLRLWVKRSRGQSPLALYTAQPSWRLGAQDDFERGPEPGPRGQREAALDALRPCLDVLQPLTGFRRLSVEAGAVVADRHEPLALAQPDHHLGPARVRMLADVCETLLHDPEHLDLLVGREPDSGIDLDVDREPAVGGDELDVAAKRGIE